MNVIPFEPKHVREMKMQSHQMRLVSQMAFEYIEVLGGLGPAFSGEVDGRIIACAGIATQFAGMGTMWAILAQDSGPYFVRLHRCGKRLMESLGLRRIEATTEADFAPGCRWLEMLGFQSEGRMRSYGLNGEDHIRYARVM